MHSYDYLNFNNNIIMATILFMTSRVTQLNLFYLSQLADVIGRCFFFIVSRYYGMLSSTMSLVLYLHNNVTS